MPQATQTLTSLAGTISTCANGLAGQLQAGGFPAPSFDENGPSGYPLLPEVMNLRFQLLDAVNDLHRLVLGPTDEWFMGPFFANVDATVLDIFNQFDFWEAIPLGGSASASEIAAKVKLPASIVDRVLQHGLATHIFARSPQESGRIIHTSFSALLVKDVALRSWIQQMQQAARLAGVHLVEALKRFSSGSSDPRPSEEPAESGWSVANVDGLPELESYWQHLDRDVPGKPKGWRSAVFAESMRAASSMSGIRGQDVLTKAYDWKQLGKATLVDVGGSTGHDAVALAEAFPDLQIVIQDVPDVEALFLQVVPEDLRMSGRIRFESHDFFAEEHTKGDVYLLKTILHDWPDKYAVQILKNLVPQLEGGAPLLLVESIKPESQMPFNHLARLQSAADLQMLQFFNSLERSLERWTSVLSTADKRLQIKDVSTLPGALYHVLDVRLVSVVD